MNDSTAQKSPPHDDSVDHRATHRSQRDQETFAVAAELRDATGAERAELLNRLVELNLTVATRLARRYAGRGLPTADLEQVACLGLVAAARRFEPGRGDDFLAFAVPTIKGELRKAFRDIGWMVRPPRRLQELQAKVWAAEADLLHELGRSPTPSEVAARLDADPEAVIEALALDGCFTPSSLDRPLGDDTATTAGEQLSAIESGFDEAETRVVLGPLVRALAPRDRRIIELRFYHGWTQQQIGEDLGVTQMQVSRLLSRILADLQKALAGRAA